MERRIKIDEQELFKSVMLGFMADAPMVNSVTLKRYQVKENVVKVNVDNLPTNLLFYQAQTFFIGYFTFLSQIIV